MSNNGKLSLWRDLFFNINQKILPTRVQKYRSQIDKIDPGSVTAAKLREEQQRALEQWDKKNKLLLNNINSRINFLENRNAEQDNLNFINDITTEIMGYINSFNIEKYESISQKDSNSIELKQMRDQAIKAIEQATIRLQNIETSLKRNGSAPVSELKELQRALKEDNVRTWDIKKIKGKFHEKLGNWFLQQISINIANMTSEQDFKTSYKETTITFPKKQQLPADLLVFLDDNSLKQYINNLTHNAALSKQTISILYPDGLSEIQERLGTIRVQAKSGSKQGLFNTGSNYTKIQLEAIIEDKQINLFNKLKQTYLNSRTIKNALTSENRIPRTGSERRTEGINAYANLMLSKNILKTVIRLNDVYYTAYGYMTASEYFDKIKMHLQFKDKIENFWNYNVFSEVRQLDFVYRN